MSGIKVIGKVCNNLKVNGDPYISFSNITFNEKNKLVNNIKDFELNQ